MSDYPLSWRHLFSFSLQSHNEARAVTQIGTSSLAIYGFFPSLEATKLPYIYHWL